MKPNNISSSNMNNVPLNIKNKIIKPQNISNKQENKTIKAEKINNIDDRSGIAVFAYEDLKVRATINYLRIYLNISEKDIKAINTSKE